MLPSDPPPPPPPTVTPMETLILPSDSTDSTTLSPAPPNVAALQLLSQNLASILDSPSPESYADAAITVSTTLEVPIHRCILSARSPFFRKLFRDDESKSLKFDLKEMVGPEVCVGVESLGLVLGYLYSGKVKGLDRNACVCVDEECEHVGCRPAVDSLLQILFAAFVFQIPELVSLYQRRLLEILDKVASNDILVILSVAKICYKLCENLLVECIKIIVNSDVNIVSLEKALPHDILKQIMESRSDLHTDDSEWNMFPDKHIKRIHRALDSDDVELVELLLKEGHTTLDDAHALHYAVTYCDVKTMMEVLDLGLADVNLRNSRGDTVLHVAAARKEPKIMVSLLMKGARLSDLTVSGRKALQICKSFTRSLDYYESIEEGKSPLKDRLCIEILEEAERRDPLLGEGSDSSAMAGGDLHTKLLYLENRVGLAKLLFPTEAKVVMDIARVDRTFEFPSAANSRKSFDSRVDMKNEAPFEIEEERINRMKALSKTVELGKRFFPRCSDVLNKIMDADEFPEFACLGNDTSDDRVLKKRRYTELHDVLLQAFTEDKVELGKSIFASPPSPIMLSPSSLPSPSSRKSTVGLFPSSSLPSPSSLFKQLGLRDSPNPT